MAPPLSHRASRPRGDPDGKVIEGTRKPRDDKKRLGEHQYPTFRISHANARTISSGSIHRDARRRPAPARPRPDADVGCPRVPAPARSGSSARTRSSFCAGDILRKPSISIASTAGSVSAREDSPLLPARRGRASADIPFLAAQRRHRVAWVPQPQVRETKSRFLESLFPAPSGDLPHPGDALFRQPWAHAARLIHAAAARLEGSKSRVTCDPS